LTGGRDVGGVGDVGFGGVAFPPPPDGFVVFGAGFGFGLLVLEGDTTVLELGAALASTFGVAPADGATTGGAGSDGLPGADDGSVPAEMSGSFDPLERTRSTTASRMPAAIPAPAARSIGRRPRPGGTGPVRLGTPEEPDSSSNAR